VQIGFIAEEIIVVPGTEFLLDAGIPKTAMGANRRFISAVINVYVKTPVIV